MGAIMQGFGWATTVGMMNNCLLVLHAERTLIQGALDEGVVKFD